MDAEQPDKWDRAHVYRQLTGFGSLLNNQVAEAKSQYELISGLRAKLEGLEAKLLDDAAKIGELQGRIDAMAEWAKKIDKERGKANGK